MMTKTEKTEQILQLVQAKMPEAKIKPIEIEKNNGQKRSGLHIYIPGNILGVCIYWDSIFDICAEDDPEEEIADCICQMTEKAMQAEFQETTLLDWEQVKPMLYKKVVNYERNQERLQTIPHQRYLDLAEVYYVRIPLSEKGWGTSEVTFHLLKQWGIREQELMEQAERNMEADNYQIISVEQVLQDMGVPFQESLGMGFYMVTNQRREFSAGVIASPKLMKQFMEQLGGDGYLIPSSVEELLVIPVEEGIDPDGLRNMIREVNQACVSSNDFLSNQLYYCHRASGEVEICMESKEE